MLLLHAVMVLRTRDDFLGNICMYLANFTGVGRHNGLTDAEG